MRTRSRKLQRKGNILALTACLMVMLIAFLAFAVDLGYMQVVRTEVQRAADASAIAAAWDLLDEEEALGQGDPVKMAANCRLTAAAYANHNPIVGTGANLALDDVLVGHIENPTDPTSPMVFDSSANPNAVRVRIRRTAEQNGDVRLFFSRVLGVDRTSAQAEATAVLLKNFRGFQTPSSGGNIELLPFALDVDTWNALMAGCGSDNWTWDAENGTAIRGADGVLEVNLFPQGTGSPGNRGTVDIGSSNNSTADIARQILDGISPTDLAQHGGKLEFDDTGKLDLNGDTGISAGVKDELTSIIGEPRIIPLFDSVVGPGNNAQYSIVEFVGIRILEVKLTGKMSCKRVIVQPAPILVHGGIPNTGSVTSHFVYSPVWLVR